MDNTGNDPRNLIVNYIPTPVTDSDLRGLFEPFGEVEAARVIVDKSNGHPKGYGFVKFTDEKCALAAMEKMNGFEVHNKRLKVTPAKGPTASIGIPNPNVVPATTNNNNMNTNNNNAMGAMPMMQPMQTGFVPNTMVPNPVMGTMGMNPMMMQMGGGMPMGAANSMAGAGMGMGMGMMGNGMVQPMMGGGVNMQMNPMMNPMGMGNMSLAQQQLFMQNMKIQQLHQQSMMQGVNGFQQNAFHPNPMMMGFPNQMAMNPYMAMGMAGGVMNPMMNPAMMNAQHQQQQAVLKSSQDSGQLPAFPQQMAANPQQPHDSQAQFVTGGSMNATLLGVSGLGSTNVTPSGSVDAGSVHQAR